MTQSRLTQDERAEMRRFEAFYNGQKLWQVLRLTKTLGEMTDEEREQLKRYIADRVAKAQVHYDDTVRFRPDYAPGPTRSEGGALAELERQQDIARWFELALKTLG